MAEAGLSMEVIAQYLGHEDVNVTRKVYARFSPTYLKQAASVLEYDDLRTSRFNEPEEHYSNPMQVIEKMVEDAVDANPSLHPNSLLRELTGNFVEFARLMRF